MFIFLRRKEEREEGGKDIDPKSLYSIGVLSPFLLSSFFNKSFSQ
jgi:hypothetical protein